MSSDEKPPDRYTKFRKKAPQKASTCMYTMSMREPPEPDTPSCDLNAPLPRKMIGLFYSPWTSINNQWSPPPHRSPGNDRPILLPVNLNK